MNVLYRSLIIAVLCAVSLHAADDVVSAVRGTVTKVDAAGKTVVVKTKEGTEHTIHFADKTAVRGGEATEAAAKDAFHGVKVGSEVVVHYSEKGADKTAVEVDKLGKDGVKSVDGTVKTVAKDGKTVIVKSADGTEHAFEVAGSDTAAAAKEIGKGTEKSAKVTVYYTEEAGKKVARFFQKL